MNVPVNMTYLDVTLNATEQWQFNTPEKQNTGFIFCRKGEITSGGIHIKENEMGILEHNEGQITVDANSDAEFIVVLAEVSTFPYCILW